mgnify:CR=1 FL=1
MSPFHKLRGQMSESMLTASFIILSGGLQDAYTYLCRDKVFANGQTGNIVLFSAYLFDGAWDQCLRYLVPVLSFMTGIFVAECIHRRFKAMEKVHWRQLILLAEIAVLFAVGFLPQTLNTVANALVSFSCAMQVQAFRKVNSTAVLTAACRQAKGHFGNGNDHRTVRRLYRVSHNGIDIHHLFYVLHRRIHQSVNRMLCHINHAPVKIF